MQKKNNIYSGFYLVYDKWEFEESYNPFDSLISIYYKKCTGDKPRIQSNKAIH